MLGDVDPLSRMEEGLSYVEHSLQRACEYIDAFRDSYERRLWGDAQVYSAWLRDAYLALTPIAAQLQGALSGSGGIPGPAVVELNARMKMSLDGIQVLGEAVREAAQLLGEAVHDAS